MADIYRTGIEPYSLYTFLNIVNTTSFYFKHFYLLLSLGLYRGCSSLTSNYVPPSVILMFRYFLTTYRGCWLCRPGTVEAGQTWAAGFVWTWKWALPLHKLLVLLSHQAWANSQWDTCWYSVTISLRPEINYWHFSIFINTTSFYFKHFYLLCT